MFKLTRDWIAKVCSPPKKSSNYYDAMLETMIYMDSITDKYGCVSLAAMGEFFRRKSTGEPITLGEPKPPEPPQVDRVADERESQEWLDALETRMKFPNPIEAHAIRLLAGEAK